MLRTLKICTHTQRILMRTYFVHHRGIRDESSVFVTCTKVSIVMHVYCCFQTKEELMGDELKRETRCFVTKGSNAYHAYNNTSMHPHVTYTNAYTLRSSWGHKRREQCWLHMHECQHCDARVRLFSSEVRAHAK